MNVFPTIYNALSGWMSRYPFSSKSTKHTVHSWGHSSSDSSCGSYGDRSRSTSATQNSDLILGQVGNAWQQTHSRAQQPPHHQPSSRPTALPSPTPSTSSCSTDVNMMEEPWRSQHIFVESQTALVAAQRRFLRAAVAATRTHLDGLVDQDEVAMFGLHYPDARARFNQGFSGQNHLRLDEWDRSLECAREEFARELMDMAQRMQYLHVDAIRELIGRVEDLYDDDDEPVAVPVASSSSTSLPTPATSPEPSRKRGLDDSDEKTLDSKTGNTSRPRPLKRARVETVKSEECDSKIPSVLLSPPLSVAAESLMASSPSSAPSPSAPASPKRASHTSAAPRRRRRTTRSTRSGTKKNH